ncbi:MAG: aminoglycoside phosphotransferase family protein [Bacillota bacterium]
MNDIGLSKLLVDEITALHGSSRISKIYKGYSSDQKFIVEKDSQKFLLKSFTLDDYPSKQTEYEALRMMQQYDVKCSRPLEIGSLEKVGLGYMLLTYIEGEEATEALPSYSTAVQYEIGAQAGKELAKMHKWHAPSSIAPWFDRKLAKHQQYIEQYYKGDVRVKQDTKVLSFIDRNLRLMKNRPNMFQHDDFHVGNLIVKNEKLSGVIDFNRLYWGDPVHEFLKAGMFSTEISIPFTIGQIKSYHRDQEPEELFWRLYSLYLAMTIISSVVWILKVKPEEITIMMEKIERVLQDHDYFNNIIPRWYLEEQKQ